MKAKTTPRISPIIRVNRKIRPVYPDWADQKWINSAEFMALEATGPAKFDASKLEQWLHDDQKDGRVTGDIIYEHHKKNDMLKDDLSLHDLRRKALPFPVHFQGKAVFGWKSVVLGRDGTPRPVPRRGRRWGGAALLLGSGWGPATCVAFLLSST